MVDAKKAYDLMCIKRPKEKIDCMVETINYYFFGFESDEDGYEADIFNYYYIRKDSGEFGSMDIFGYANEIDVKPAIKIDISTLKRAS